MGASSREVPTAFGPLRQVLGLRCRYLRTHGAPRNTCLLLRVGNQGACQGLPFVRATLSILAQLGISPWFGFSLFLQWAIVSEARPISPCALCAASVICPKRCESLTTGLWQGPWPLSFLKFQSDTFHRHPGPFLACCLQVSREQNRAWLQGATPGAVHAIRINSYHQDQYMPSIRQDVLFSLPE
jgi:hypothetical protein